MPQRMNRYAAPVFQTAGSMTSGVPSAARLQVVQRSPRRVSVTIPHSLYEELLKRSDLEGRSVSNLAAFLLEFGLQSLSQPPSAPTVFDAPRATPRATPRAAVR